MVGTHRLLLDGGEPRAGNRVLAQGADGRLAVGDAHRVAHPGGLGVVCHGRRQEAHRAERGGVVRGDLAAVREVLAEPCELPERDIGLARGEPLLVVLGPFAGELLLGGRHRQRLPFAERFVSGPRERCARGAR